MIQKIFGIIAIGILAMFFFTAVSFVLIDVVEWSDAPDPEDDLEFDFTVDDASMEISAPRDSEFMVWTASQDDPFYKYEGKYSGREQVDVVDNQLITVYEVSDNYYSDDDGRYRGGISLPVEQVQVDSGRSLNYNTIDITEEIETRATGDSRLSESEEEYIDYSLQMVGDEREFDIEIEPEDGSFNLGYMAVYQTGDFNYEIENIEIDGELEFDRDFQVENSTASYTNFYDLDSQMIDEGETFTVTLKVRNQNGNLSGLDAENLDESDGLFLLFKDETFYGTNGYAGSSYEHPITGENLGYQEDVSSPFGGDEGISIEVR